MQSNELRDRENEIEAAVDLLDELLRAADGGPSVVLGSFEASTLLALLTDRAYRVDVMSRVDGLASVDSGE